MGLFTKKIGPVFLKEESDTSEFIRKLQIFQGKADGELKEKIEKQIRLATYGQEGEKNVAFELKNSGIDMYILHDIYLESGDLSAQIDYIVITRKRIYVIECKNLFGNIEIDREGNFIRSYELFRKHIKEGIYSPITQNQRHLQVMKEIRKNSKGNFVSKIFFEKYFDTNYKSVVVLANPKTYLNVKYAKKEIKEQVIRADQLSEYIKRMDAAIKDTSMNEEEMRNLALFYLENSQQKKSDYARKYEELLNDVNEADRTETETCEKEKYEPDKCEVTNCQIEKQESPDLSETEKAVLVQKLKAFRLEQSRKESIKPYYIFNDNQMEQVIEKNPKTRQELLEISGFGNVKVEKYGDCILEIINA